MRKWKIKKEMIIREAQAMYWYHPSKDARSFAKSVLDYFDTPIIKNSSGRKI